MLYAEPYRDAKAPIEILFASEAGLGTLASSLVSAEEYEGS